MPLYWTIFSLRACCRGLSRLKRLAIAAPLLWSCGTSTSGEPTQVAVAWRFADGRTCDTSGVSIVAILSSEAPTFLSNCQQGFQRALTFAALSPGEHQVTVEGRTSENTLLYRSVLSFSLEANNPRELDAVMVFEGGP